MLKLCRVHERVAEAARRSGPKHQCMLNAVSHLGNALMELDEYAESEAMIPESLVLQREVLRPEPESTKLAARNLLGVYKLQYQMGVLPSSSYRLHCSATLFFFWCLFKAPSKHAVIPTAGYTFVPILYDLFLFRLKRRIRLSGKKREEEGGAAVRMDWLIMRPPFFFFLTS